MSRAVDEIMLQDMINEDIDDIMFGTDVSGRVIDLMNGFDETTGEFDEDSGMLFPPVIKNIPEE